MSGLSAKTYSCGGEGSLFRGGEASFSAGMSPLRVFEKNFSMPFFSCGSSDSMSDSDGGGGERDEREDKSERSSLAIFVACRTMKVSALIVGSRVLAAGRRAGLGWQLLLLLLEGRNGRWGRSNKAKVGPHP